MATELYSINKGNVYSQVTKTTGSSTTAGMELTIDLAKFTGKKEAIFALEELIKFITRDGYLPA